MLDWMVQTDAGVVRRVLAGHHEEFSILVERYLPAVQATAMARMRNRADADDVTQETFFKAYQSIHTLRERGKFGAWLLTIARNTCVHLQRKQARETPLTDDIPEPRTAPPNVDAAETAELLHRHILALDEDKREVLLMHYFAGKSLKEMAVLLDIKRDAVAKRLQRARDTLGQQMLAQIEAETPRYQAPKEKVSALMGILLAAPVPWQTAGAATVAGIFAGAWALKAVIVAAAATVLVAATVYTFPAILRPANQATASTALQTQPIATTAPTRPPASTLSTPSTTQSISSNPPTPGTLAAAPTSFAPSDATGRVYDGDTGVPWKVCGSSHCPVGTPRQRVWKE